MTSVVLDASAVLALVREEPGGDKVPPISGAAISAMNLHGTAKDLLLSGLPEPVIGELLGELRLEMRAHDAEVAFAAGALHEQKKEYGRGLGDQSFMALAISLGIPALTVDCEWRKVKTRWLELEQAR